MVRRPPASRLPGPEEREVGEGRRIDLRHMHRAPAHEATTVLVGQNLLVLLLYFIVGYQLSVVERQLSRPRRAALGADRQLPILEQLVLRRHA